MPSASPIFTSFNGGEISLRMQGRTDVAIYRISTAEMLNFVPTIEGPALKRSGFRYIRAAQSSATWLSAFIFNDTQAYLLEWGVKLRFYTNGGRIESGPTSPYEVTVPYSAAEAPLVSQQQNYDRLYLAHGSYPPASLLRTGATTFSYGALTLKNGPFADRNTNEAITVTASATTGAITITASSGIFLPGHVGGPFMVEAMGFSDIEAWQPNVRSDNITVNTTKRRSDGKVYLAVDKKGLAGSQYTGTIQPTHTRGAEWDGSGDAIVGTANDLGGVKWQYLYDTFGVGTITGYTSATQVTVSVTRRLADSLTGTAPSFRWYLPAISAALGWPKHNLLAFGRMIYFTDFEMMASVVADYGGGTVNMAPFTDGGLFTPDMAFRRRLEISNPILWVKGDRDVILVGTADGVYAIRKINSSQIFASDNVECVKQGHFGVARCPPAQTGSSTIIVQAGGRKLRETQYDLQGDRYTAPNINVWQRHILKGGAKQLAFQGEPEELLVAVRADDGALAVHPYVPEQEVKGFARIVHAAGPILSACALPGGGGQDELWVLVSAGGSSSVQLQDPAWEEGDMSIADAFYVDSGATYSGAPTTTVSGLTHLSGKDVAVLADGAVVTGRSVNGSGQLTPALASAASKIQIGLPYTARLTWLRPELSDGRGNTIQAKIKRLVDLALRVLDTGGVKVDGGAGHADELIDRPVAGPFNTPVPLFNGDTTKPIGGKYSRDGQASIISSEPLPCMIVAAMPKFELSEG